MDCDDPEHKASKVAAKPHKKKEKKGKEEAEQQVGRRAKLPVCTGARTLRTHSLLPFRSTKTPPASQNPYPCTEGELRKHSRGCKFPTSGLSNHRWVSRLCLTSRDRSKGQKTQPYYHIMHVPWGGQIFNCGEERHRVPHKWGRGSLGQGLYGLGHWLVVRHSKLWSQRPSKMVEKFFHQLLGK